MTGALRKYVIYLSFLQALLSCSSAPHELLELDDALSRREVYQSYYLSRVKMVSDLLHSETQPEYKYQLNMQLANEYQAYSYDSTIVYLQNNQLIAKQLNDEYKIVETDLLLADEYLKAGVYYEANVIMNKYNSNNIPDQLLAQYYLVNRKLAGDLMFYSGDNSQYDYYKSLRDRYRELLGALTEPDTADWAVLMSEEALDEGNFARARSYLEPFLVSYADDHKQYALLTYYYALTYRDEDEQAYRKWLSKSALADVMSATRDYAALMDLSRALYRAGDVKRAFEYSSKYCMPDAIAFNGHLRPVQITHFFPEIQSAYELINRRQKQAILLALMLSLVLFGILIVLLMQSRRRQSQLMEVKSDLENSKSVIEEMDKVKQSYITLFLSMFSANVNTSRSYKNHVLMSIRQGKIPELENELESLPPIEKEINEFYKMFDSTFLKLFPDFVDKFNSLLKDGASIRPKVDGSLNAELRVFALIKLGISDSGEIASLLHYSPNTIYNYRAKIKNLSRYERDLFEDKVRNL